MKIKNLFLAAASGLGIFALTACDTEERPAEDDPLNNPTATAPALEAYEDGDAIQYTFVSSFSPNPPFITDMTFGSGGRVASGFGLPDFEYLRSGDIDFELVGPFNAEENLQSALALTLGDPSPQGTRIRQLLLRNEAVFTQAEINELLQLLNPAGGELSLNADNPLQIETASQRRYIHRITSTNADFTTGVMAGNYRVIAQGFVISFREPTPDELSQFRLLTSQHKIPFVTNITVTNPNAEVGRWLIQLGNRQTN